MFFNLIDVALVKNHIAYMKLGNYISLLNFKTVVAEALISRYNNSKRSFPISRSNKRKFYKPSMPKEVSIYMPEF